MKEKKMKEEIKKLLEDITDRGLPRFLDRRFNDIGKNNDRKTEIENKK